MAQENKKLKELEEIKKKCAEYLCGWKRERADFLNYKKEEVERISQLAKFANEDLILKLLPVLDNMCLAVEHIEDEGVQQIKKQLEDFLKEQGIEALETINKPFDPATMEAVGETESPDRRMSEDAEPGTVIEEVQRGYTMHGKVIRPARVKISK